MEYNEILKRIKEIILESVESIHKVRVRHFDIDETLEEEFTDLIRLEYIWHELSINPLSYATQNGKLINELSKIKGDNEEVNEKINRLMDILSSCTGLGPKDLDIVGENIVSKNNMIEFHMLAKELHVGPYKPVKDNERETKEVILNESAKRQEQHDRIAASLNLPEMESSSLHSFIDSKHRDVIYLANRNLLSKANIFKLLDVYKGDEYLEFLNDLRNYSVINDEDYSKYFKLKNGQALELDTIEQIVEFLSNIQDFSMNTLKFFKTLLSSYQYKKLLYLITNKGLITYDEYMLELDSIKDIKLNP